MTTSSTTFFVFWSSEGYWYKGACRAVFVVNLTIRNGVRASLVLVSKTVGDIEHFIELSLTQPHQLHS